LGVGKVYLVGAGPGDPKLLTLRALQVLQDADVVLCDKLVTKAITQLIPKHVVMLYTGKSDNRSRLLTSKAKMGKKVIPHQSKINRLLISYAKMGKKVIRLKGGDPFIFARGGEEINALRNAAIPFEVIPGVSSALAAPALAGIPLTHRLYSSSVVIVPGREDPSRKVPRVDWSKLSTSVDTIVILMGAKTLPKICREILKAGLRPETPVAAIEWASTDMQKTLRFTLEEAASENLKPMPSSPCVVVVGRVVSLSGELG